MVQGIGPEFKPLSQKGGENQLSTCLVVHKHFLVRFSNYDQLNEKNKPYPKS
jgi:hypothetical protein